MNNHTNILVVEDDENLRLTLEDILDDAGYTLAISATLSEADRHVKNSDFDLIILDIMLPDGNGYDFCKQLRENDFNGMVLMLTARSFEEDLVTGFNAGADDYLTKPYRTSELVARVKALLRRNTMKTNSLPPVTDIGQYSVDRNARLVKNNLNGIIELTPKEYELLLFFLDQPHQAHHRQVILDGVWGEDRIVDSRTVDNFVSSLKKKLNLTTGQSVEIQTVRGIGYRLEFND